MKNILWLGLACLIGFPTPATGQDKEVTIGTQAWEYDRVYPLLDGLFQDAASTQLQQLILDPNKANSTQLDALIQSIQVQAGFNQLSGVQNSVAAQMAVANLGYQSTLAQQQQSILVQSIAAQQALTKANQDLANATQSKNQSQIDAANIQVQNAQTVVTGLAAQAALIKGSGTPWAPSAASGNIAATPTSFTSGVPSSILGSGLASSGPSFPATKQMDNQMDLLWSRLARVVGTMARPDTIDPESKMFMIEFDTATFPKGSRKGKLLETRYSISCGQVVDLFPHVAAVNVANTKYRDNATILGVALSLFSVGVNASYNREHLRVSQMLGQSSYITGYGVDRPVFGWKFGIPLGDNFVSSDTKRTFAVISAPSGCSPVLQLVKAAWEKPNGSGEATADSSSDFDPVNHFIMASDPPAAVSLAATSEVQSISFNRASYDPTKYSPTSPVLVAVAVALRHPIDQQANLYVNGILLKRARDTFGRAVPNGTGSGGLLEQSVSISQANTWIPVSPHNLLITLDAGQFGSAFPSIQIVNPGQSASVSIPSLLPDGVLASISGRPFECLTKPQNNCNVPSLGYQNPINTKLGVFLWKTYCDPDPTKGCVDKLVLQAPPLLASTNASAGPTPQVVTASSASPWGPNPEVYLSVPTLNQKLYRLNCDAGSTDTASNLVCAFWDGNISPDFNAYDPSQDIYLQVIDQAHAGGTLSAALTLRRAWGRGATPPASLWDASNPQWYDDATGGHWEFKLQFANVDESKKLQISPNPYKDNQTTSSCRNVTICTWKFSIKPADVPKWFDRMELSFADDPDSTWYLLNIRNQISPYVTVMSPDFSSWSGSNFTYIFKSSLDETKNTGLVIGAGAPIPIDCPTVSSCIVTDPKKLPKDPGGAMYLQALNRKFPLLQVNADGTTQTITYQPKSGTAAPGQPSGTGTNPTQAPSGSLPQINNTIVIGGSTKN